MRKRRFGDSQSLIAWRRFVLSPARGSKPEGRARREAERRWSCRPQRLLDRLRVAFDAEAVGAGRPLGHAATLLPMTQSVDATPEPSGALFLWPVALRPARLHIAITGAWTDLSHPHYG